MLPPVPNPEFGSFVKIVIQLSAFLKHKDFTEYTNDDSISVIRDLPFRYRFLDKKLLSHNWHLQISFVALQTGR